jgi:MFS family permease
VRRMPPMFRALRNRNYRLWATGNLISVTGSWMQLIGLNWVVLQRTGSVTSVGLSVMMSTLPALLFGPWAGALADRAPARRIILTCQAMHALLAGILAFVVSTDAPITAIYALTAAAGLVGVFDGPALGRFAGTVVSRDELGNALALGSVVNSSGRILGMSSAAVLAAALGTPMLFVLNAISFTGVIAMVLAIRKSDLFPLAVSTAGNTGVKQGLRYVSRSGHLMLMMALGFVLSGLGRNYQVTMAAMSNGPLHGGAAGYGLLSTVFAVGTVVGGLVAASRKTLPMGLLLGAAGVTSALQMVSGVVPGMLGFALVLLPIAAGAVVIDTTAGTRLQLDSDDGMRGRVLAINSSVSAAAGATGAPLLGWLCQHVGASQALLFAGTVTLLATLLATLVRGASPERRAALAHRVLRRPAFPVAPDSRPQQPRPATTPRTRDDVPRRARRPRTTARTAGRQA